MGRTGRTATRRGAMAMGLGGLAALAGCGPSRFYHYDGPAVTQVMVLKTPRRMHLLNGTTALKSYDVQLGFAAHGPKRLRGDGRTPEGRYRIDRRNPNSAFYLSIGIDYPNAHDRAWAEARGLDPGGDVFVHGWGDASRAGSRDWTAGCIAVRDHEMRDVYAMVRDGTPITIYA